MARYNPTAADLVEEVVADWLANRLAQCSKCRRFLHPSVVAVAACTTCLFRTARCAECGGKAGARRSVLAHDRWYTSDLGVGLRGRAHVLFSRDPRRARPRPWVRRVRRGDSPGLDSSPR